MTNSIDQRIENVRKGIMKRASAMKEKVKKQGFAFKPFSVKQKQVLTWWCPNSPVKDKDGIIADGSIRSGKTLCMSLSYVLWAMNTFNRQNFGMAGKTIGAFRRNVLFWLKLMLLSRGYSIADHRSDNLLIVSKGAIVNYFYIFGGKDERSQDLIQGITLAGMFFDEVALMPESFVNQATGRCSVTGSKFWFNCNPDSPRHWFKINWIDKCKEKNIIYLHFIMDDNLSLAEENKKRYYTMYDGVFFKRYVLGLSVGKSTKQKAVEDGFLEYHNWESETKSVYEKYVQKLRETGAVADAIFAEKLVEGVSAELKTVEQMISDLISTGYDMVYITENQSEIQEKYKKKLKGIEVE